MLLLFNSITIMIIILLFNHSTVGTVLSELNIGTTLFTRADLLKECWSSENIALLTSRMILEDILPPTSTLTINNDQFVEAIINYYRLILETVRGTTHGKTKYIILVALTDLLGGYLHYAIIPMSKFAFYAGLIDRVSVINLLNLLEELKWFLRTNGQGWSEPLQQYPEGYELQRIPLHFNTNNNNNDPCKNLIYHESRDRRSENQIQIPMPFFDNKIDPSSIALPLKHNPLHNLESNESSYVVMKFFVSSYKCLIMKNADMHSFRQFENNFNNWLEYHVMPLLNNVKFYTAFGGVLRIRETLKSMGNSFNLDKVIDNYSQMNEVNEGPIHFKHTNHETRVVESSNLILIVILSIILIWILIGSLFICYKIRSKNQKFRGASRASSSSGGKSSNSQGFPNTKQPQNNLKPAGSSGVIISTTDGSVPTTPTSTSDPATETVVKTDVTTTQRARQPINRRNKVVASHKLDDDGFLITTTTPITNTGAPTNRAPEEQSIAVIKKEPNQLNKPTNRSKSKKVQSKQCNPNKCTRVTISAQDRALIYVNNDSVPSKESLNEKLQRIHYPNIEDDKLWKRNKSPTTVQFDSSNSLSDSNSAAIIETNHSVTSLPAITEASETGSSKRPQNNSNKGSRN